jgi:hypothetical protein
MRKVYVCFDDLISLGCAEARRVTDGEEVKEVGEVKEVEEVEDSGERRTPPLGFLRKDMNRKGLRARDMQGCDFKGVRLRPAAEFVVGIGFSGACASFTVRTEHASEAWN